MWLIIRKSDHAVIGTQAEIKPPDDAWNPDIFEIKEWYGLEPLICDSETGICGYDPTLDDPTYPDFLERRGHFDELADKASSEIEWLEATIPDIDGMAAAEVRAVVKRLARENLETIRAWRYVIRRLI